MQFYNFEYDGILLSDMGYVICRFDSGGPETTSNGSRITFHTVPGLNGARHDLTGAQYDECLGATIQICKIPCRNGSPKISSTELRALTVWLNRKEFHKLRLLEEDYPDVCFEASFNVSKIEIEGTIYGLELEMVTNRPFALHEPVVITLDNPKPDGTFTIFDSSDEEGFLYPRMEITILEDGDLTVQNGSDSGSMRIGGCLAGEVITLDYPVITSSLPSHKIQNDFNWHFFRIVNTFQNRKNVLTVSLPCSIKITYSPIIKIHI